MDYAIIVKAQYEATRFAEAVEDYKSVVNNGGYTFRMTERARRREGR